MVWECARGTWDFGALEHLACEQALRRHGAELWAAARPAATFGGLRNVGVPAAPSPVATLRTIPPPRPQPQAPPTPYIWPRPFP